jgi:DNA-binding NarL/FixJ family response regulator
MKKASVIIVDDHQLFRNGLKFIINETPNFEVVAEAANGLEFLALLKNYKPDLVLLDINMPVMNGFETAQRALEMEPDLKILVLSMLDDEEFYNRMIEVGVKGFMLKDTDSQELVNALKTILEGKNYFSQELLISLLKQRKEDNIQQFTHREKEILALICEGLSNQEISDKLHISPRTVERHRSSLMLKTESNNSIGLVIYAFKNKLIKP